MLELKKIIDQNEYIDKGVIETASECIDMGKECLNNFECIKKALFRIEFDKVRSFINNTLERLTKSDDYE